MTKLMAIDTLKKDNEAHKKEFERVNRILRELESKSNEHDEDLSKIKADMEMSMMNLSLITR